MEEIWRSIIGAPCHEVSTLGRVRSLNHVVTYSDGRVYQYKGKILSEKDNGHGYKSVHIGDKTFYIHRLVAQAFIPNPENKSQVDHIDTNRSNNMVCNLRWVTGSENNRNELTHKKNKDRGVAKRVPIVQINAVTNEVIKVWNYTKEIEDFYHIHGVLDVANGRSKTLSGFVFIRECDYDRTRDYRVWYKNGTASKNKHVLSEKMVVAFDEESIEHIKMVFHDTTDAAIYYRCNPGRISYNCRSRKEGKPKRLHGNVKMNDTLFYLSDLDDETKAKALNMYTNIYNSNIYNLILNARS